MVCQSDPYLSTFYRSSKFNIKEPTKPTLQIIQNFSSFSLNENLKRKGSRITEIRQKSKTRQTVIFDTELEMPSYLNFFSLSISIFNFLLISIFCVVSMFCKHCSCAFNQLIAYIFYTYLHLKLYNIQVSTRFLKFAQF